MSGRAAFAAILSAILLQAHAEPAARMVDRVLFTVR